ncbi:type II toxin-antitoxin system RelE/ParE family toxin [Escherichia coli]|nr:type II toxin-antitoxin system RelE/ParE family toxin [Klebsiella pneumoniae]
MPQVIFAPAAIRDMQRLREFLRPKNPDAAKRAGEAIRQGVKALGSFPRMGRLIEDLPEQYREWLIDFGDSGYVARYRIDGDLITILAVRHQKEAGFQ